MLMDIGQMVIDYIYESKDYTHIYKLINNNFIKGIFAVDEGNYFREEVCTLGWRRNSIDYCCSSSSCLCSFGVIQLQRRDGGDKRAD